MSNFQGFQHRKESDFNQRYSNQCHDPAQLKRSKSGKHILKWQKEPSGNLVLNYNLKPEPKESHLDDLIKFEEQ